MNERGGEVRRGSKLSTKLIIGGLALLLPSSLQADAYSSSIPPYDIDMVPAASSTPNITITPTGIDTPTISPSAGSSKESVEPVPSNSSPMEQPCQEGKPEGVALSGFFDEAPVEDVTKTPDGSAVAAPTGRDELGAYNTVGFYEEGALPGSKEGIPYFLAHSTRYEHSLLYPNGEVMDKIRRLKELGQATVLSVYQKNGSVCRYSIAPENILVVREGDFTALFEELYADKQEGRKEVVFVACANEDPATGRKGNYRMVMFGEEES